MEHGGLAKQAIPQEYFKEFFYGIGSGRCSMYAEMAWNSRTQVSISAYKRLINLPQGQQPASVVLCSLGRNLAE